MIGEAIEIQRWVLFVLAVASGGVTITAPFLLTAPETIRDFLDEWYWVIVIIAFATGPLYLSGK